MSIDLLFADFDRLIQSAESVHRLRRFILELAVRGKLVPQDPNDEPALELMRRIEQTRDERHKRKLALIEIDPTGTEIDAPENWKLAPLGALGNWAIGAGFPKSEQGRTEGPYFFLKVSDMNLPGNERVVVAARNRIDDDVAARIRAKVHSVRTIIFPKIGGAIATNKRRILGHPSAIDNNCLGITISREINLNWAYLLLTSLDFTRYQAGTAVPALQQGVLERIPIAIPPGAEQSRIVAKVDELMALCDRLEAARAEREATRDRLATASLDRLNTPDPDPTTFQHDVAFALNNLTPLTTRPDQINALRQSILNLAVRGKLVPQDAKEDRSNQGKLRSDTTAETYDVRAFEGRMALLKRPDNWTIEPLSRVSSHIVDCLHTTPKWTEEGVLCIKTNQVRAGQLDLSSPHFVSENTHKTRVNRLEPRQDDILYIREGGVLGVACRVPSDTRLCLGQRLMQIRANNAIAPQFLELCLNSPWITEFAAEKTTGGAAPRVNMSIVRSYPIPLPPLGEQHRIVAKVDELKALCNRLEARLNRVGKTRGELVELLCARVA